MDISSGVYWRPREDAGFSAELKVPRGLMEIREESEQGAVSKAHRESRGQEQGEEKEVKGSPIKTTSLSIAHHFGES